MARYWSTYNIPDDQPPIVSGDLGAVPTSNLDGDFDHGGKILELQSGDYIWGIHTGIEAFYIASASSPKVYPLDNSGDGGYVEIYADYIQIDGILDGSHAGHRGGAGGGGGGAGVKLGAGGSGGNGGNAHLGSLEGTSSSSANPAFIEFWADDGGNGTPGNLTQGSAGGNGGNGGGYQQEDVRSAGYWRRISTATRSNGKVDTAGIAAGFEVGPEPNVNGTYLPTINVHPVGSGKVTYERTDNLFHVSYNGTSNKWELRSGTIPESGTLYFENVAGDIPSPFPQLPAGGNTFGVGGSLDGESGTKGGYNDTEIYNNTIGENHQIIFMGSGGGGGAGGYGGDADPFHNESSSSTGGGTLFDGGGGGGGGAGGSGGGSISLLSYIAFYMGSSGSVRVNGQDGSDGGTLSPTHNINGTNGGDSKEYNPPTDNDPEDGGSAYSGELDYGDDGHPGGDGGHGSGGGLMVRSVGIFDIDTSSLSTRFQSLGGGSSTINGGPIKIFITQEEFENLIGDSSIDPLNYTNCAKCLVASNLQPISPVHAPNYLYPENDNFTNAPLSMQIIWSDCQGLIPGQKASLTTEAGQFDISGKWITGIGAQRPTQLPLIFTAKNDGVEGNDIYIEVHQPGGIHPTQGVYKTQPGGAGNPIYYDIRVPINDNGANVGDSNNAIIALHAADVPGDPDLSIQSPIQVEGNPNTNSDDVLAVGEVGLPSAVYKSEILAGAHLENGSDPEQTDIDLVATKQGGAAEGYYIAICSDSYLISNPGILDTVNPGTWWYESASSTAFVIDVNTVLTAFSGETLNYSTTYHFRIVARRTILGTIYYSDYTSGKPDDMLDGSSTNSPIWSFETVTLAQLDEADWDVEYALSGEREYLLEEVGGNKIRMLLDETDIMIVRIPDRYTAERPNEEGFPVYPLGDPNEGALKKIGNDFLTTLRVEGK